MGLIRTIKNLSKINKVVEYVYSKAYIFNTLEDTIKNIHSKIKIAADEIYSVRKEIAELREAIKK